LFCAAIRPFSAALQIRDHPWYNQPPAPAFSAAVVQLGLEQQRRNAYMTSRRIDEVLESEVSALFRFHHLVILCKGRQSVKLARWRTHESQTREHSVHR